MKVLIVDDEQYIVEYLNHLVDWRKLGFTEVLTVTNGAEVLTLLKETTIQLVISDIRMPEISGLQLAETIAADYPLTKVIFLTGYADFDYAKTAIRHGVTDYILKPVDKEQLEGALLTFKEKHQLPATASEPTTVNPFLFLMAHLTNNFSQDVSETAADYQHSFVFFKGSAPKNTDSPTIWGNQTECWGFTEVPAVLKAGLLYSEPFTFSDSDRLQTIFYAFFATSRFHKGTLAALKRDSYLEQLKNESLTFSLFPYYQQLEPEQQPLFLMECLAILLRKGQPIPPELVLELKTLEQMSQNVAALVACYMEAKEQATSGQRIVQKVNQYIDNHLAENLNLEDLAREVYVHPAYLSKLYKQETNENLSVYITLRRMKKAAQLLIDSNLMVSDIGKMVGYKTAQYFIKIFKEKYAMTPQQYRRANL